MRLELKHTNLNMGVMGTLIDSLERILSQLYKHDKSCCPSYLTILFANYTSKKLRKKNSDPYISLYLRTLFGIFGSWPLISLIPQSSALHAGDQKRNNSSVSNFVQDAPFTDFPPPTTGGNATDWSCNIK